MYSFRSSLSKVSVIVYIRDVRRVILFFENKISLIFFLPYYIFISDLGGGDTTNRVNATNHTTHTHTLSKCNMLNKINSMSNFSHIIMRYSANSSCDGSPFLCAHISNLLIKEGDGIPHPPCINCVDFISCDEFVTKCIFEKKIKIQVNN